jgi:hypothetical protein
MHTAQRAPVLLALQQTHGNRYVQRVVMGIQAKLKVGPPGDVYEQEADRVADEVMRIPEPGVQRQAEEEEEEDIIQTKPLAEQISPLVQRQVEEEEKEEEILQTKESSKQSPAVSSNLETYIQSLKTEGTHLPESTRAFFEPRFGHDSSKVKLHTNTRAAELARTEITPLMQRQESLGEEKDEELIQTKIARDLTSEVTPAISSGIQLLQGGGRPLSGTERSFFEPRFGADFSNVRIHSGKRASNAAQSVNARAFTFGHNVVFGAGEYSPNALAGRKLLAHELMHVVQQNGGQALFSKVKNSDDIIPNSQELSIVSPEFVRQTIQSSSVDDAVQLVQHPAAARQSRVTVATSVHSFRPTYPNTRGGQLTQRLRRQLRDRRRSVAGAVGVVGEGSRTFGARPTAGEERAGVTLGTSATATGTATRRAVVVGNGDYDQTGTMGSTVEPLRDIAVAVSEAGAMASMLQGRGYDVRNQDNQTAVQIGALLQAGIAGLGAGDELVFYYHGHGTIEGLIGRDGSVYMPAQMAALRSTARRAQVDLTLALEGCHTGVFADAIRGAELRDTRAAMQARVGATSRVVQLARQLLLPVLDNAIAIQEQKDAFNTRAQTWWARRFQIEQQMAASPGDATLNTTWETHYDTLQGIWNNFVTAVTPLLSALRTSAVAAGFAVQVSQRIASLSGTFNQDGEQAIQAGLDDLDTILNRVLRETDSRLR